MAGLHAAAGRGAFVFGECGGYMALGDILIDAEGQRHRMAGLLALEASFAERKLQLGYRKVELVGDCPLGAKGTSFRGHEFHYASVIAEAGGDKLFEAEDALGASSTAVGGRRGSVAGSFLHLVDLA
jgi:cobyrinic acid a,c-diamide synthase